MKFEIEKKLNGYIIKKTDGFFSRYEEYVAHNKEELLKLVEGWI